MDPTEEYLLNKQREFRFFTLKWFAFWCIGMVMVFLSVWLVRYQLLFRPRFERVDHVYSYLELVSSAFSVVVLFAGFVTVILLGDFLWKWWGTTESIQNGFKEVASNHLDQLEGHVGTFEALDFGTMTCVWKGVVLTEVGLYGFVGFIWLQQEMVLRSLDSGLYRTNFIRELSMTYSRQATGSIIRISVLVLISLLIFLLHYYWKKRRNFNKHIKNEVLSYKYDDRLVIRKEDEKRYISYYMVKDISLRAVEDKQDVRRFSWPEFDDLIGEEYKLVSRGVLLAEAKSEAEWYRKDVFNQS